jgi:hypothetical protein
VNERGRAYCERSVGPVTFWNLNASKFAAQELQQRAKAKTKLEPRAKRLGLVKVQGGWRERSGTARRMVPRGVCFGTAGSTTRALLLLTRCPGPGFQNGAGCAGSCPLFCLARESGPVDLRVGRTALANWREEKDTNKASPAAHRRPFPLFLNALTRT